jgi:hypothetical protein
MSRSTISLSCQAHIWGPRRKSYYCPTFAGLLMWGALSDERTGLSFTIAACPRQRSYSRVRFPRDSWSYFTVSDSNLPQPEGSGPRIYTTQKQGRPVIFSGTGFSPPTTTRATVEVLEPASTLGTRLKSKFKLLYDWRFTANQFVLASTPWDPRPEISFPTEPLGS